MEYRARPIPTAAEMAPNRDQVTSWVMAIVAANSSRPAAIPKMIPARRGCAWTYALNHRAMRRIPRDVTTVQVLDHRLPCWQGCEGAAAVLLSVDVDGLGDALATW